MNFEHMDHPHRRYNPLLGEYILVSPHRTQRPWQGRVENQPSDDRPAYDPDCYLCPRNQRKSGDINPDYENTFVFTNDFAALLPDSPNAPAETHPLFRYQPVSGTSRVICFSPRHDLTLAQMSPVDIRKVVDLWAEQSTELGARYQWVQVFENRGDMMGSSNPHPHGQIWAEDALPNLPQREDDQQRAYYHEHQSPLLLDYAQLESEQGERAIVENDHWLVVTPFWATWPFETLLMPKAHILRLPDLNNPQRDSLSAILKRLLTRYDNLFETSFPYSMGWHGAPFLAGDYDHWLLHAHFYPPLLRSATIRKFMVGYELLAEAQRDLTPEQASARLRELSDTHYTQQAT
jgi:UDPglucose--hexose-1-phosphate uridylyltransferase